MCGIQLPLIKLPTFFKNLENLTRIDHILTNHPKSFPSSSVYETGFSDFHKLTLTVKFFTQGMNLKSSNIEISVRADLLQELSLQNIQLEEFQKFKKISSKFLIFEAELFARCSLIVFFFAVCSLLFARCSLLFHTSHVIKV